MTDQTTNLTPQQTLKNMRIMWFAMLMGQVLFAAVVIGLCLTSEPESFESVKIIYMVAVVWGLMSVPISAFIRMQIYKKNWVENCVTPKGYASGMILSMAMIEVLHLCHWFQYCYIAPLAQRLLCLLRSLRSLP